MLDNENGRQGRPLSGSHARIPEEDELRHLFDLTLELLCVASVDGRFLQLNPVWETVLGYRLEELTDRLCLDLVHPDDVASTQGAFRQLASGASVTDFVNRYRCTDGSYRALEWRSTCDGERVYAAARDITQHRRADEVLQQMAAIVEYSEDAIYCKDRDFLFTSWNKGAERLYGYTPEEVLGKHVSLMVPDDRLDELHQITERCLRGERVERTETVRRRKDGRLVDVSLTISPLRDPAGRLTGSAVISRDVTERNRATQALQYERDRAQRYLDVAEVIMVALDVQGCIGMVNRKGCQLVGYCEEDLLGHNWFETCVPHRHRELALRAFGTALAGSESEIRYNENTILSKTGAQRLIAWRSTILKDPQGRISGTLSCGVDVTDERAAAAEREHLIAELQAALAEVKTLSGLLPICSHCKKVRDDKGYWHGVELYVSSRTDAIFSHGVCPDCLEKYYPWMNALASEDLSSGGLGV